MSYSSFSRKKDKSILYFIFTAIAGFAFSAAGIWAVVEFVLYLVKDNPFNWTSLWLTIILLVVELFFMLKTVLSD